MGIEYTLIDDARREYFMLGKAPQRDQLGAEFQARQAHNGRGSWFDVLTEDLLAGGSDAELMGSVTAWWPAGHWRAELVANIVALLKRAVGKARVSCTDAMDFDDPPWRCVGSIYSSDAVVPPAP